MNWRDIIERAAWTFVQSFIAALAAAPLLVDGAVDLGALAAAALAGVAAVLSLVKGIVATKMSPPRADIPDTTR